MIADRISFSAILPRRHQSRVLAMTLALGLTACGALNIEADYPENEDMATAESGSVFDFFGFGGDAEKPAGAPPANIAAREEVAVPAGLGVNADLWRAALDTVSFLPLASADPIGGTIITDWYNDPAQPSERVKLNIIVSGLDLRADALRVSLFREKRDKGRWVTVASSPTPARQLENIILTKARDYKIARGNF